VPDLTKGEGPAPGEAKGDWFLHCGRSRGWAYRDDHGKCDDARQILVTKVPVDSPVRRDLEVGDVILGVSGEYFSRHAVYEFRDASRPAQAAEGTFEVILWRPGWEKEKRVELDLGFLPLDFTKGDVPGLAADWNLGPTGARGWLQGEREESVRVRQILVTSVEEGSPAAGILQKGDVILGVEGKDFDRDVRRAFSEAVTRAETRAGKGRLQVRRWRAGSTDDVVIPIQVLGSYSSTTPWRCRKTKRILDQACDYLINNDILNRKGVVHGESIVAALALMATGEREHMRLAKGHVYKLMEAIEKNDGRPIDWGYSAWGWGYSNLLFTEYYLLTKDKTVLPFIETISNAIAEGQSAVGSWGHRMANSNHGPCHGYGAMNQAGNICWMTLLLAKRCGVTSDEIEQAIQLGYDYLEFFINKQPIPYGDHINIDCNAHDDNGKCSSAACAYAILGDEAGSAFYSRMTVASYAVRERGHTGNWWSFLWGPLGASRAGKPACSAFLHEMAWLHDLERRWDGGFTYQGKAGVGYGVDEASGRQKGGAEHQYGGWDTTGCRILMYCLPFKRLCITGRDVLETPIPKSDIADVIEAGRPPATGGRDFDKRYDGRSIPELKALLGSWSPAVRYHAALSVTRAEGDQVPMLLEILDGTDRYARYGACTALRKLGDKSATAVDTLMKLVDSDDQLLQTHAIMALGEIGDPRAVAPLLELAAGEFKNDRKGIMHRIVSRALFAPGGLLAGSIDGVDRELLYPAVRRLLRCKGGHERSLMAAAVLKKLTFKELEPLWPDLVPALRECAPTGVMFASGVRQTIATILAENKVEEGMPLLLEYMKLQKPHGSGGRNKIIMDLLTQYGAAAKPLLPAMETYLAFLEQEHPWVDRGQPPPAHFYKNQVPHVKDAMDAIRAATNTPELVSIEKHLQR